MQIDDDNVDIDDGDVDNDIVLYIWLLIHLMCKTIQFQIWLWSLLYTYDNSRLICEIPKS